MSISFHPPHEQASIYISLYTSDYKKGLPELTIENPLLFFKNKKGLPELLEVPS